MNFWRKKIGLLAMTIVFVFVTVFGALLIAPRTANAQWEITGYKQGEAFFAKFFIDEEVKEVKLNTKEKMMLVAIGAITNGLNYFTNKIAYDMGVWLASGNLGQGPFANQKNFRNYVSQVAGDSLGEIIGSMGEMIGINLCQLPDLRMHLALVIGFHFGVEPPKPTCSWQELKEAYNMENIRSQYATQEGLMNRFTAGIAVNDTDFGVWFQAKQQIDNFAIEASDGKKMDRQEGGGINPKTDIISGKITVPAQVMAEEYTAAAPGKKREKDQAINTAALGMAVQKGGISLAVNTAATFVNTFLGTVLKNFIEKGMLPGGKTICNPGMSISGLGWNLCLDDESMAGDYYGAGTAGGSGQRRAAQEMFSELLMPQIRTIENYDPTGNMAECSPENLAPDACIVDQSFLQILSQANFGQPMTIKQAMEMGYLKGDWKLYSSSNEAMNQKRDCALEAYCNRNLKMLRLLRIMPLGLEIASQISPEGNEATLKEVVDGYYNSDSAYYKLVNPYWVIKLPKTRCGSFAYSAVNYSDSPIRIQYCADIQHCVAFNKDGSCANWGYCLREKPIWNFDADYCDAQYNTCLAFTAEDKSTGSYLLRTLDTVSCNEENDGCRRYSQVKYFDSPTSTDWFPAMSSLQSNDIFFNTSLYFNKQVPACDLADDGCSAFKLAVNPDMFIYLRKAPDYLGCYDADGSVGNNKMDLLNKKLKNGIQWPQNFADLNLINPQNKEACAKYAQVCLPEEENCNYYTSVLTREVIPGKFTPATVAGGIITWNDQCDAKCVGYDAYREMPSNYSNGEFISYIIPQSGRTCSATQVGCSSFTNLASTAGGMEQNEYFAYLRPCILPDQNLQRNYTVYERSETKGYEIRTFTLVKSDESNGPKQIYRDGAEMNKYMTLNNEYCSEASYNNKTAEPGCMQFIDEFGGTHYAVLSKTVIVSEQCTPYRLNDTELIPYAEDARCPFDFDNGFANNRAGAEVVEFRSNACHYMGFTGNTQGAGDSIICSANSNTCRAYKGNAGFNIRRLFENDFENVSTTGWAVSGNVNIAVSTESTQLDGHSLRVSVQTGSTNNSADRIDLNLVNGKSYILSFWAKGNLQINQILLGDIQGVTFTNNVLLTDVWRYYSFGPVEYNGADTDTGKLRFLTGNNTGQLFIDNVILTAVEDYVYLVKDSLRVDPICDSNLQDNLPGEALGCSAYTDPINTMYYLTNFSYLCRESAIGCTALLDTFNTPEDSSPRAYNVWLELKNPGQGGVIAKTTIDNRIFECSVPVSETGCYVDMLGLTAEQINSGGIPSDNATPNLVASTIYIPPQTPADSPIYLVANREATCKSENMGCQVVGRSTQSVSGKSYNFNFLGTLMPYTHYEIFDEIGIKNNPALYDSTSCYSEAEGCKSWTSAQSTYYFKDPQTSIGYGGLGKMICEYQTEAFTAVFLPETNQMTPQPIGNLPDPSPNSIGWVWKDTGVCVNITTNMYMGRACASDNDCISGTDEVKCMGVNKIPCYPKYRTFGTYGLWSFGTEDKYTGFAGLCPSAQSGCNEFVDWSSTHENKKCSISGKKCNTDSDCAPATDGYCIVNEKNAYYLIDNNKLTTAQNACNGQVSQAEGCVLLDKTSNPNKYWNANFSYYESRQNNDILVSPIDGDAMVAAVGNQEVQWLFNPYNDSNIIIKVTQDRVCGEWAYCDLKQEFEDETTGEIKNRCYHLGMCNRAGAIDTAVGRIVKDCAEPSTQWDTKNLTLTTSRYVNTMIAWDSWDFSGYSVHNHQQVPDITARKIGEHYRMVIVDKNYSFLATSTLPPAVSCYDASNSINQRKTDGSPCGIDGGWGYCYSGECLRGYNTKDPRNGHRLTCRAYAEEMSPFRHTVLSDNYMRGEPMSFKPGFEDVNLCYSNNGNPVSCDWEYYCSYRKLKTDGGEIYKRLHDAEPMNTNYICSSGPNKGIHCSGPESTQCGEDGVCSKINSFQVLRGWLGYCMEWDKRQRIYGTNSNSCLIWWPLENPPGSPYFWEEDPSAGYEINEGMQNRYICLENEPVHRVQTKDKMAFNLGLWDPEHIDLFTTYSGVMPKEMVWEKDFFAGANSHLGWGYYDGFGISNIPVNSTVLGCVNTQDTQVPGWMRYGQGVDEKESKSWFCPINRDVPKMLGYNQASCGADNPEHCSEYYSGAWTDGDDQRIFNYLDGPEGTGKYINVKEIERIDVFFDDADLPKGGGYVSFIVDAVGADDERAFQVVEGGWKENQGEVEIYTAQNDLENFCFDNKNWRAWHWSAKTFGNGNWFTTVTKQAIRQSICDDDYKDVSHEFGDDHENMGVRIVFDDLYNLRGIWINVENDLQQNGTRWLGYFFVIHTTSGKCKTVAQVSEVSTTTPFTFKPYTNALRTDSVKNIITDDDVYSTNFYTVIRRWNELNGGKFGLAYSTEEGYINIKNFRSLYLNPFIPRGFDLEYSQSFQGGDYKMNYAFNSYTGGIPLVTNWDSLEYQDDPVDVQKATMLKKMFAKIYGEYRLQVDDDKRNNFYLLKQNTSQDASSPNWSTIEDQITFYPPQVAAPSSVATGSWVYNAISVNNKTSGNIYIYTGSQARIQFYAWAHGNQMPVRRIVVDKGEGVIDSMIDTGFSSSLPNRKWACVSSGVCTGNIDIEYDIFAWQFPCNNNDQCFPLSQTNNTINEECSTNPVPDIAFFGNTRDTGCKDKPWNFMADYNCPYGTGIVYRNQVSGSVKINNVNVPVSSIGVDWPYIRQNFHDAPYVCVAQPRVHVTDNWGWCTGDCTYSDTVVSGKGCYSEMAGQTGPRNDCDIKNYGENGAWVKYDGYVVVVPLTQ